MKKKSFVLLLLGVIICIAACGKKKEDVSQADNVDNLNEKNYYALSLESLLTKKRHKRLRVLQASILIRMSIC